MNNAFAFVHIIDIAYGIDKDYSYYVPLDLRNDIKVGSVVVVPFGNSNKRVSGVVIRLADKCKYKDPKPVHSIMQYPFEVPDDLIKTCSFMRERFFCTFGSAFRTVIPPGVNLDTEIVYYLNENRDEYRLNQPAQVVIREIEVKGVITEHELYMKYGDDAKTLLNALTDLGVLRRDSRVPEKLNEKNLFTYTLCVTPDEIPSLLDGGERFTEKQTALIDFLSHHPAATMREIEHVGGFSHAIVNALVKKHIIERTETAFYREAYSLADIPKESAYTLSEDQQNAVDGIRKLSESGEAKGALLFGVTGSGKTRVIIEAAKAVIASGRQVIVLLPEIGLASQAVKAYAAAFGERLVLIHSMLSVGERTDAYRKILAGEKDIVIGTRSAVFAPFKSLGMIAIDEEQAHTYKSEMQPKYSAIDVARFRCSESKALMLLASATPSIESFYKAKKGVYSLFRLDNRFSGAELPEVIIEDLRDDMTVTPDKLIGVRLTSELMQAKSEGKQALLFVNRRGFNSHVSCRACGNVFTCPHCSVSLTYHAYEGQLRGGSRMSCHYCGYVTSVPERCNVCGTEHISYSGFGTQKLQDEIERDFPDLKLTRMDSDTTGGKFSHDKLIDEFSNGSTDILIGTQMISKGLDFPNVSVAGAISVDSALYMDDFRAGERTFALVTQLVGRAGRAGKRGKAILQTYNPDNEILQLAATQDYERFYESEIKLRKAVLFPPFCSIAVFGISSQSREICERYAALFRVTICEVYNKYKDNKDAKIILFGPFEHSIYKVMGKYRQRLIIKYKDCTLMREFLNKAFTEGLAHAPRGVRLDLDVNPTIV